jgi:hypothetical protein
MCTVEIGGTIDIEIFLLLTCDPDRQRTLCDTRNLGGGDVNFDSRRVPRTTLSPPLLLLRPILLTSLPVASVESLDFPVGVMS